MPSAGAGRGWLASSSRQTDCTLQIAHPNLQSGTRWANLQSAIQEGPKVSNYTVEELIARWKREELTIEQAIGQILLLLKEQDQRLRETAPPPQERRER